MAEGMSRARGWDSHFDPQTTVVGVWIGGLRGNIDRPFEKKLLHTGRGVGYVLRA